ncbi:MAG: peptidylprolyl isomerase, partial [Planctomycetota bacterium]
MPIHRILLALPAALPVQSQGASRPAAERPRIPSVIDFEKHAGLVLAEVDGRPVRLAELAAHLEARYDPGIQRRWRNKDTSRELNVRNLPQLLYQYVDALCLAAEIKQHRDIRLQNFEKLVDRLLEEDFEGDYRKRYEKHRKITESSEPAIRRRHRRERGLAMEVKAYLELLQPGLYKTSELRSFHQQHGDYFGGKVRVAHILFSTRDAVTGRLFREEKQREIRARCRDLVLRLQKDPGLFAELARSASDDRVTAPRGGEIGWIDRFDKRLPAPLVRAAWELDDGAISLEPVETYYGLHLVRRVK